jgi:hypothetical protein
MMVEPRCLVIDWVNLIGKERAEPDGFVLFHVNFICFFIANISFFLSFWPWEGKCYQQQ